MFRNVKHLIGYQTLGKGMKYRKKKYFLQEI